MLTKEETVTTNKRVYVACSVSLYHDRYYNKIKDIVERLYWDSTTIIYARGLYTSMYQFTMEYIDILDTCDELVFFVTDENTIGRGTWLELFYMQHNKPVYLLTWQGEKIPYVKLLFEPLKNNTEYKKVSINEK